MTSTPRPVFITGGARTGSEMLKTMLSASPDLDFVDELFLLCPPWLHRDLNSNIRKHVGKLSDPGALDRLMDLLYSGIPEGWFWSVVDRKLDRGLLRRELSQQELSLKSILRAIMRVHAQGAHKRGLGAKFPVHYSHTDKLLEWFPDCRLLHTTRNPKATYASQAAKYLRKDMGALTRGFTRFQHFVHINIQTAWTARLHRRLQGLPNYRLVRYEDIVLRPEEEIGAICDFLDVQFLPAMLNPHQYGSSFDTIGKSTGVDRSSLERWRKTIWPLTARIIDVTQRSAKNAFGYSD